MTRSVYVTITAQVFFDDDEVIDIMNAARSDGRELSEDHAIEELVMESVNAAIKDDSYIKVRDIVSHPLSK